MAAVSALISTMRHERGHTVFVNLMKAGMWLSLMGLSTPDFQAMLALSMDGSGRNKEDGGGANGPPTWGELTGPRGIHVSRACPQQGRTAGNALRLAAHGVNICPLPFSKGWSRPETKLKCTG